ncbi:MAG: chitobiase/beta-hexosaminidase C-terminal domain-containing protein, partial [Bacteroidales bacterium]|nr:chitobiase/beta-hexosaminidase C-terminal domain-containing protein [Bacteroidales bacterium]
MRKRFLLLFLFGVLLMSPLKAQELKYSYPLTDQNPGDLMVGDIQKFLDSLDVEESGEEIAEELLLLKKRFHVNYENKLIFSHESGYFNAGFDLDIETETESEHLIYYTLDGSIPTPESFRYREETPIEIVPDTTSTFKATVVRARSYCDSIPTSIAIPN